MLDRGRRPLPGEPDFDRVKLCHCGSSRNPSQAPLPAGFRETGREGQLFPSGSSAALLVIWGYITSSFHSSMCGTGGNPSYMEHSNFRHPARKFNVCFSATCVPFCKSGSTPTANSLNQHETVRLKFESG